MDERGLIFIHGLNGSSLGFKATFLRERFPEILTPDFDGPLAQRMDQLESALGGQKVWTIIGSSLGGLMAAMYCCQHPERVKNLVLLAPALIWPDFAENLPPPVSVPTVIYQGSLDDLIPHQPVRSLAEQVFKNLSFRLVEDDHGLHKTVKSIDWQALLA